MSARKIIKSVPQTLPLDYEVFRYKGTTNPGNPLSPLEPDRRLGWVKWDGHWVQFQLYKEYGVWKLLNAPNTVLPKKKACLPTVLVSAQDMIDG